MLKKLNFMILLMTFLIISCSKNEDVKPNIPNNPIIDTTITEPEKKVFNELSFLDFNISFSGFIYIGDYTNQGQLTFKKISYPGRYTVKIPGEPAEVTFEYLRKEENFQETKYFYKVYPSSYSYYEVYDFSYDNSGLIIRHIKNTNKIECKILLGRYPGNTTIRGTLNGTLDSSYQY
jgi:hypothetical protein